MASKDNAADADAEYESDPEDSPLPSMRRRAAASDDEEASDGAVDKRKVSAAGSDDEANSQGGAEPYGEDDDGEGYDDADEQLEEEEDDELGEELEEEESREVAVVNRDDQNEEGNKEGDSDPAKQGEKKENEPFAVPTSGAFYMHDDRFQESNGRGGRGRRRVQGGGRKIWNAKEEGAWVHDRFEEMNLHDNGRRRGRGGFRGGRGRGGPQRGSGGLRSFYNNNNNNINTNNGNNNNVASRPVRGNGRGFSRRYEPVNRNNARNNNLPQDKQVTRNQDGGSISGTTNTKPQQSSLNPNFKPMQNSVQFVPKKNNNNNNIISSSNLNSASPPFYPSSSESRPNSSSLNPNVNNNNNRGLGVNSPTKTQYVVKTSSVERAVNQVQPSLGEDKSKGKQQSGFVYGGAPGGEQGFAGTPALLPVMQFSGQHPGVPALGMAVPGYVANSQSGFGNPAWVIAGAGGGYPYVAGYYNNENNNNVNNNNGVSNNTRPSSQASSTPSSNSAKSPDPIKSSQKPDISNEELGQRQNKPRRYSEMNFGQ